MTRDCLGWPCRAAAVVRGHRRGLRLGREFVRATLSRTTCACQRRDEAVTQRTRTLMHAGGASCLVHLDQRRGAVGGGEHEGSQPAWRKMDSFGPQSAAMGNQIPCDEPSIVIVLLLLPLVLPPHVGRSPDDLCLSHFSGPTPASPQRLCVSCAHHTSLAPAVGPTRASAKSPTSPAALHPSPFQHPHAGAEISPPSSEGTEHLISTPSTLRHVDRRYTSPAPTLRAGPRHRSTELTWGDHTFPRPTGTLQPIRQTQSPSLTTVAARRRRQLHSPSLARVPQAGSRQRPVRSDTRIFSRVTSIFAGDHIHCYLQQSLGSRVSRARVPPPSNKLLLPPPPASKPFTS